MQATRPRTWFPEHPGAVLQGELVRTDEREDKNGKTHDVAVVRDPAGVETAIWLFRPGLGWNWDRCSPQEGDTVRVTRIEDRQHKGRTFADYAVEIVCEAKPLPHYARATYPESDPF